MDIDHLYGQRFIAYLRDRLLPSTLAPRRHLGCELPRPPIAAVLNSPTVTKRRKTHFKNMQKARSVWVERHGKHRRNFSRLES